MKIELKKSDPVLEAADRNLELRSNSGRRRQYLGLSGAGKCPRQQAYEFKWAGQRTISARGLKAIADGYATEEVSAKRLQGAAGMILHAKDPETGEQWAASHFGGHVRGHLDGIIENHPVAPKTPHVWEHKAVNEKSLARFRKLKNEKGEKAALKEWNYVYWAQAQCYMASLKIDRHYIVVSSPGARDWEGARTDLDRDQAEFLLDRLHSIVTDIDHLPDRISDSPNAFACRFCDFNSICHEGGEVERNCRTCRFSRPIDGPDWHCSQHDKNLSAEEQEAGCDRQRFRSSFIPGYETAVDGINPTYRLANGTDWSDTGATNGTA